jgi:hypothetical protein
MVVTSVIPARQVEGIWSKAVWATNLRLHLKKKTKTKRAGGMAQVIEQLPRNEEALNSNSRAARKKKEFK